MGKPTGFMDYKRQELALRPPQERIKDWEEIKTSSLPHKEELQKQAARCMDCGIPFCHSGVMLGQSVQELRRPCGCRPRLDKQHRNRSVRRHGSHLGENLRQTLND